MRQRDLRSWASAPVWRLLLLGFLVVGLLQMHSFGHVGHDQGGSSWPIATGHAEVSAPAESPHPPPAPEPDAALELLAICLAVLSSVGLIGALVGLLAGRFAGGGHRNGLLTQLFAGRGPPSATAPPLMGSQLARLSVWRI